MLYDDAENDPTPTESNERDERPGVARRPMTTADVLTCLVVLERDAAARRRAERAGEPRPVVPDYIDVFAPLPF